MNYTLQIERLAQKQLSKMEKIFFEAIDERIKSLKANPRPPGCKKLQGSNAWRIRVGDYRVVYEIKDNILLVIVIEIDNRKNIYRK